MDEEVEIIKSLMVEVYKESKHLAPGSEEYERQMRIFAQLAKMAEDRLAGQADRKYQLIGKAIETGGRVIGDITKSVLAMTLAAWIIDEDNKSYLNTKALSMLNWFK